MRAALCWSLPCLLLAQAASAQGYRAIKDWVGGCDNTRHCSALGLAAEDAEVYTLLQFERGPAADDEVRQIRLRVDRDVSRASAWVLRADDAELLQFSAAQLVDADSGPGIDFLITDPDELAAMMGAMRGADTLTLVSDGEVAGVISLSGASAVMLWIDEQQQRLGTPSALVRRGDRALDAMPAPAPAPRLVAQATASELQDAAVANLSTRVRQTLEADSCEEQEADSPLRDSAWSIGDRQLVQLSCYSGAYNFGSSWFLVAADGTVQALRFPIPASDGSGRMETTEDLVNAGFDASTGVLDSFSKGRGIGDCGSSGRWAWDGRSFQLMHYQLMNDCRGVSSDLWPVLWRSAP
jgi:hypothetical protein